MMKRLMLVALCLVLGLALSEAATKTLDIFFIDVEGGQATLVVTPAGQSLLIDAGYGSRGRGAPAGNAPADNAPASSAPAGSVPAAAAPPASVGAGRDADRIMAAVHEAHLDHIDYLLITHFHPDHVGGVPELAMRIPIGTFIDYGSPMGTDRMATNVFRAYEPVRGRGLHLQPKPGDRLPLKGIEADIVSSAGDIILRKLSGGGQTNAVACSTVDIEPADGTENFRSIGLRLKYGEFRFLDLGDLMGITLASLVCPINLLGEASVYLVPHHGNYDANVPAVLAAVKPRVAIMNNGATKGGDPDSFSTLHKQRMLEDLWQLHLSKNRGAENADEAFIANLDDGQTSFWIKLMASDDGRFTIMNGRTGLTKAYPARAK